MMAETRTQKEHLKPPWKKFSGKQQRKQKAGRRDNKRTPEGEQKKSRDPKYNQKHFKREQRRLTRTGNQQYVRELSQKQRT